MNNLFLTHWSDIHGESKEDDYIDYEALLQSDDEFLCFESLILDQEFDFDEY